VGRAPPAGAAPQVRKWTGARPASSIGGVGAKASLRTRGRCSKVPSLGAECVGSNICGISVLRGEPARGPHWGRTRGLHAQCGLYQLRPRVCSATRTRTAVPRGPAAARAAGSGARGPRMRWAAPAPNAARERRRADTGPEAKAHTPSACPQTRQPAHGRQPPGIQATRRGAGLAGAAAPGPQPRRRAGPSQPGSSQAEAPGLQAARQRRRVVHIRQEQTVVGHGHAGLLRAAGREAAGGRGDPRSNVLSRPSDRSHSRLPGLSPGSGPVVVKSRAAPHLHVRQARAHLLGVDHAAAAVQREAVLAQRAVLQVWVLPGEGGGSQFKSAAQKQPAAAGWSVNSWEPRPKRAAESPLMRRPPNPPAAAPSPPKGMLNRGPAPAAHRRQLPRQLHHADVVAVRGYAVVVARLGDEHTVRGRQRPPARLRDEGLEAVHEERQAPARLPVRHGDAEGGDWQERRAGRGVKGPGVHNVDGLRGGVRGGSDCKGRRTSVEEGCGVEGWRRESRAPGCIHNAGLARARPAPRPPPPAPPTWLSVTSSLGPGCDSRGSSARRNRARSASAAAGSGPRAAARSMRYAVVVDLRRGNGGERG
jgi:hypothetical protein